MPSSLLLKLVATPLLIGAATLAGRRWGPALSGWLVGLPLTSAPVVFFLALDHGVRFASSAAIGVILGTISQAAFAVAYVWLARRTGWVESAAGATIAFALATVLFQLIQPPAVVAAVAAVAALLVGIWVMPPTVQRPTAAVRLPGYDLPLRMAVATGLVIGLTAVAPAIGARLSGLLSPFPVYAGILAVFAHRLDGSGAAVAVWRGLLFGLFAFVAFFSVLGAALEPLGIGVAFVLAMVAALGMQSATLFLLRSSRQVAT